jgi:hypothetical protein
MVNGVYTRVDSPLFAGRPYYQQAGLHMIQWTGTEWIITTDLTPPAADVYYVSASLSGPWSVGPDGTGAVPTVTLSEFSSASPAAVAGAGTTPSNASPEEVAPVDVASPSNSAPIAIATGTAPSNAQPEQYVLPNEQSPIGPAVGPDQPIEVAHTAELDNDTNYRVVVGNRGAPVTIDLPEPPGLKQWIEIIDASQQADTYPITVDAGAESIEGAGSSYVMWQPGAVLEIYYTNSNWKIL